MGERAKDTDARNLVQELLRAFDNHDWDRLLTLYHPEALLNTLAAGEQALSPSDAVVRFKQATEDSFYDVSVSTVFDLDPNACLAVGRARFRNPQGGATDSKRYWLYVFKDGLLWRGSVHRTRKDAIDTYRRVWPTSGQDRVG